MLGDVLNALACPVCGAALEQTEGALRCDVGHSFDVGRQGYVNLLPGRAKAGTADTTEMIAARQEFLDSGAYEPIFSAVVEAARNAVDESVPGVILDIGSGTGHYLAALLDAFPDRAGVALDISKHAARVAARSHERVGAIVADAWAPLPLRPDFTQLILVAFSPRNADEFARVLAPGGTLIIVTPNPSHLWEIVGPLGLITVDPRKGERLAIKLGGLFEHVAEQIVEYPLELSRAQAASAVSMGPSAVHKSAEEIAEGLAALPEPVLVNVSITVGTYRQTSVEPPSL